MSKRNYNVFFNTHTVSGIVISVALYIIFFAGAFALFKEEIAIWQTGEHISHTFKKDVDYDKILSQTEDEYELSGRDIQINFGEKSDKIYVLLRPSKDSLTAASGQETAYFSVDINSFDTKNYVEYYDLGEFLYRLHFFAQIPGIGAYLAGFVSLFFLFAIVTGVIVHWKKIISNFYAFNPRISLKRVWADAHTALGIIGLPFQFIFSVTGAYFCLSILVLIPANFLYHGDQNKLMEDLRPERKEYEWIASANYERPSFNQFAQHTASLWDNFHLKRAFIRNYGGSNMKYVLQGEAHDHTRFVGMARVVLDAQSGKIAVERAPTESVYTEDVQRLIGRLHFADYGGLTVKIIYFLLAFVTCFVIITGVLVWLEARNKKNMSLAQRRYTAKVGHIYLAICLSMFPVTALAFLFVKLSGTYFSNQLTAIYTFYFITWLIASLFFRFKRDNYLTNKYSLLSGAILGFLIPIVNGLVSGNWLWLTYSQGQYDIFLVDALWIILASTALFAYTKITPAVKEKSSFTKLPIDYKNLTTTQIEEASQKHNFASTSLRSNDKNYIPMRTKIVILWLFLGLGWIVHHIYGLFNIYYNESLMLKGATGEAPLIHHVYRIVFEGICLLFALLSLELSKQWFKYLSFAWAIIAGLYNVYHLVAALLYEPSNISEIFMLLLVMVASVFLVLNLNRWRKPSLVMDK